MPPAIPAISSRQNPLIEELRDQRDDLKGPRIFLEGPKLLEEALKSGLAIETLAFVPSLLESELIQRAIPKAKETVQITPYVLKSLSDVEAPQGIIAVARKPHWDWATLFEPASRRTGESAKDRPVAPSPPRPILILDGIQDPGNAASIVRTAEAAGVAGVVTTLGTARFFAPKALRASAGSSLRLPILEHRPVEEILQKLQEAGYSILGTASEGETLYSEVDWGKPWAILLGQEGGGISAAWKDIVAVTARIPMKAPVESLNVAATAAILLYESTRPT